MNYQNFTMLGRMTRDPELKFLPSNVPVVTFGMACSRKYRTAAGEDREETLFIDCQAFAKPAEILSQYGSKGKPLLISGRLRLETWEDKNGGGKRSKISCTVENFQFCGGREQGQEGGESAGVAAAGSRPGRGDPFEGPAPFNPDDIPYRHSQPERTPI